VDRYEADAQGDKLVRLLHLWLTPLVVSMFFFILTLTIGRLAVKQSYSLDTNFCQYTQGVLFKRGVLHGGAEHFQSMPVYLSCMVNPLRIGYASKYPPGYSGLIALGLILGDDSLINPLCGALTVLLTLMLIKEHYRGRATFFWGALLSCLSTYLLYMSAEFWNHPSALLACTLLVWVIFKRGGSFWFAVPVIILALTFCSLTRPLSSLAMTFCLGASLILECIRNPDSRKRSQGLIGIVILGTLMGAVALAGYNYLLTGDPLLSGYEALHGPPHNPGFHVDPYGRNFTVWEGLKDLWVRWRSMNHWLFMWPIPSLSLLVIWLVSFKKWQPFDAVCVLWILAQSGIYCFMWSAGQVQVGPRFLYEALPAILILSARGMSVVEEAFGSGRRVRIASVVLIAGLSLYGLYGYLAWADVL
jgi:hypothetical protein